MKKCEVWDTVSLWGNMQMGWVAKFQKTGVYSPPPPPPMVRQPPVGQGLLIIEASRSHTTHGVTPLDEWWARRRELFLTTPTTNIHALGEIRTHNPSKRAAAGPHLNPLNAELNPICHLLALLGAHHFFHISRIRDKPHGHWDPSSTRTAGCLFRPDIGCV